MTFSNPELPGFGWTSFYQSQVSADELDAAIPARVTAVHRARLDLAAPGFDHNLQPFPLNPDDEAADATVGDWLLLDAQTLAPLRRLERRSVFKRRAVGTDRRIQLIAANVDTLFIVTSCNQDFNIARMERYLVLAREAGVMPIIVITKADQTGEPETYTNQAARLQSGLLVETLDARNREDLERLAPWLRAGETIAFVGSSGVGKSTLVNTLVGNEIADTAGIREDDAKGRHTTTARMLHQIPGGAWVLDTPGMRELQLTDVQSGIEDVFADIVEIAARCRFSDCRHEDEPGCAIQQAIASGELSAKRLKRWNKLAAEDAFNSASLAERRQRARALHKMYDRHMKEKRRRRGD